MEAAIDVLLGAAIPLEPMDALTPERIGQLTAWEIGAEAATNLLRYGSAKTGITPLGDITTVGLENVPLTNWGGIAGRQRNGLHRGRHRPQPVIGQ